MKVIFYDTSDDAALRFAVILAKHKGKWVFCRHRERTTWEIPGGHREEGETIEAAARRELWEETGAADFALKPVCVYGVCGDDGRETRGMLYAADIAVLGELPPLELSELRIAEEPPEHWTYPHIQPLLLREALRRGAF